MKWTVLTLAFGFELAVLGLTGVWAWEASPGWLTPFVPAVGLGVALQARLELFQRRIAAEGLLSIRPAVQLVLLDAHRLAHLEYLPAVIRLDDAYLVVRVELPVPQDIRDVCAHRPAPVSNVSPSGDFDKNTGTAARRGFLMPSRR